VSDTAGLSTEELGKPIMVLFQAIALEELDKSDHEDREPIAPEENYFASSSHRSFAF
jgi:hypothetical protein